MFILLNLNCPVFCYGDKAAIVKNKIFNGTEGFIKTETGKNCKTYFMSMKRELNDYESICELVGEFGVPDSQKSV